MAIGSIASGRLEPTTVGEMRVSPAGGWMGNQRIPFGFNPVSPLNVVTAPTTASGSMASGMLAGAFNASPLQQRSSAVPKFPEGQTASVRDWSQNPAVAAAMKTGNVSEIEKATIAARDAFRAGGTWADMSRQVPLNPTPALQQRTPEQQQDLLAQMRERGGAIRQRLDQESIQRGYAFRQGLAETEAQRALTPAFGTTVTQSGTMRGAQAEVEAERWKQAQAGRSPMSQEPLGVGGIQFRGVGMGQFAPVKNLSFQKGDMTDGGARSFGGGFPSFDEWMQQKQPSLGDILRGGGVSSRGDFSDFALERSRRAVREKQKQDEWRRNQIDAGLPVVTLPVAQANGLPRYVGY